MKIDFSWIEDEADRVQLMALWEAGDRDTYFRAYDAVWIKQGGKGSTNSHQPNPNEDYYGDENRISDLLYLRCGLSFDW